MSTRITLRFAIAFLLAISLTPAVTKIEAQDQSLQKNRFVAHEWGTFTSVSTADGAAQYWNPLSGPTELPSFVYRSAEAARGQCIKCDLALVRMETPVVYFYSDRDLNVSVKVDFPRGRITEWYPQARTTKESINWGGFIVEPRAKERFPVDRSRSHYYPARETDAAPIRLGDEQRIEQEKFLFYRGIGNFDVPLSTRLAGDQVIVRDKGREGIAGVIVFENREGRMGWRSHGALNGEYAIARPTLGQPVESLHCEMENALVAEGLNPKEAAAMVKTWRDSWFEEGLRVFYIVPRRATDAILPITIKPAPSELTRVFVGRAEIITPEMEKYILAAVKLFNETSPESREAAIKSVQRYGRFADPVLRGAVSYTRDVTEQRRIWDLMVAATKARTK
jgi:hypothetical protein